MKNFINECLKTAIITLKLFKKDLFKSCNLICAEKHCGNKYVKE